jgi:hypothetical protein
MKYTVGLTSGVMICIRRYMTIGLDIQVTFSVDITERWIYEVCC